MDTQALAANLRRLREQHELTQERLAAEAGLSRVGYADLESGEVVPKVGTLHALASALGVGIQALLAPAPRLSQVRFRSLKRLTSRAQILVDVAHRLAAFNELEDLLQAPTRPEPPILAVGILPEELAKEIRRHFQLDDKEPIRDICGLLEANGYKVLPVSVASDAFFGMSVAVADGGPAVVVNVHRQIAVERRIFSAAHELGHLLMHLGAFDVADTAERPEEEAEANAFASHFLMPEPAFQAEWRDTYGLPFVSRVLKVKRMFRVSYRTVLYRLQEQGLDNAFVKFQVEHKKTRGRTLRKADEPESLERMAASPAPEPLLSREPERVSPYDFEEDRLPSLVRRAIEQELITVSRGAEVLGLNAPEMRARVKSWVE